MNVPDSMPSISAVLFYSDLAEASEWLCRAFGFSERTADRVTGEGGEVVHAELELGNGLVILSQPYDDFAIPGPASVHHQALYVFVDDAEAHHAQARSAGAEVTAAPRDTDYGARVYSARDLAGYHWLFAQQL